MTTKENIVQATAQAARERLSLMLSRAVYETRRELAHEADAHPGQGRSDKR